MARAFGKEQKRRLWSSVSRLTLLAIAAVLFSSAYALLRPHLHPQQSAGGHSTARQYGLPLIATPFIWPAIQKPHTYAAAEAPIRDNDMVIGVSVAGKSR